MRKRDEYRNVLVAMSGGVDSSVAALLLKRDGYDVSGAMLRLFNEADSGAETCAAAVANRLGIPFQVYDLTRKFRESVIEPFASEYANGRTPNPCVVCNRRIKFGALLELAGGYFATGHYARIVREGGRYLLKKGVDEKKDQSYVLFSLTQEKLARVLLPLGALTKAQVRELARENSLESGEKKESQDICFIPDGDHAAFLERISGKPFEPGDFTDDRGEVIGRHSGIARYTIGQRRGTGVSSAKRLFVTKINADANTVTLGENKSLFESALTARSINLIAADTLDGEHTLTAKIRYGHTGAIAAVRQTGEDELRVKFQTPQRAITKGQYVVLYDGDTVVGGGTIEYSEE